MILCWRTVRVPPDRRGEFLDWIAENRPVREHHGILFELVLERAARQNPAKAMQPPGPAGPELETVIVSGWPSHDALDAWINTPARDSLTDSEMHRAVAFRPLVRFEMVGGYLNLDGLAAMADAGKEEP
jgi:hypothetical protein